MLKIKMLRQIVSFFLSLFFISSTYANEMTKVDVYQAKLVQQNKILSLTGTVEAKQNSGLATLQSGVVANLFVEVGDHVKKGQKLLSLDAKLAELSLLRVQALKTAAMAEKAEAERLYREVVNLSKQQLVAETLLGERLALLDIAKAEVGRVNAELIQQKEILSRHTLYAPFAGVIAQRQVNLGEWVTPQAPVFTLVEQENMRLNIAIPQEYFPQLTSRNNVTVIVRSDLSGIEPINAKLDRLVGVASDSSRTVVGLIELPSNTHWIAGMSARADIVLPSGHQSIIWLPKSAIKQHPDGGSSVFIVENNKAKRVLVKVVRIQNEKVAVSGADADKAFIMSGVELLRDGDSITINQIIGDSL